MAERAGGVAAGLDDFAFVWLGVGLGLAAVINGQVRRGVGGAAGEIGWMPVHGAPLPAGNEHPSKAGLQALAGGHAVQALAAEHGFARATPADAITAALADLAVDPRGSGAAFIDDFAHRVAIGVAAVCVVLDPGLVVLGGTVGKAGGAELAARVAAEVPRLCLAGPHGRPHVSTRRARTASARCRRHSRRPAPGCSAPSAPPPTSRAETECVPARIVAAGHLHPGEGLAETECPRCGSGGSGGTFIPGKGLVARPRGPCRG